MNTQLLISRMNELGFTYRTVAAKTGLPEVAIKDMAQGRIEPTFYDTIRLARFLGLHLEPLTEDVKAAAAYNLGRFITEYCKERDWEVADFAEASGVDTATLRGVVGGTLRVSNHDARRIAELTGLTLEELAAVYLDETSAEGSGAS